MKKRVILKFGFLLLGLFGLRTLFGLCYDFWFIDNIQIYLIGLKFFTTGQWPFFGPDIVASDSVIPGALQGLLTGLPLFVCPLPEAPTIFLNILSFAALLFFAWYLHKRIGGLNFVWTAVWVLTIPAAVEFSTITQNPSYVLIAALPFFISVFELFPFYKIKLLSSKLCFFLLGSSLFWIWQLHMSWVLLLPYVALSFLFYFKENKKLSQQISAVLFFTLGSAITSSVLLPTLLLFPSESKEALASNTTFNPSNLKYIFSILQDFFSYPVFAFEHFLPYDSTKLGIIFPMLKTFFVLVPLLVFLTLVRLFQYIFLLRSVWIYRNNDSWRKPLLMLGFTVAILWSSFLFTNHKPNVHKYYLIMPVAVWFGFQVFTDALRTKLYLRLFKLSIIATICIYAILPFVYYKYGRTLYNHRGAVVTAIDKKDYTFAGLRRVPNIFKTRSQLTSSVDSYSAGIATCEDFEIKHDLFLFSPQYIVNTESFSGTTSCKCDSVQPYSHNLLLPLNGIEKSRSIMVSAKIKGADLSDLLLVFSVDSAKKNLYWKGLYVKDIIKNNSDWNNFEFEFPSSDIPTKHSELNLTCYLSVLASSKTTIYIDDFCLRVLK